MHLSIPLYTCDICVSEGKIEVLYILDDNEKFSFQFHYEM